MAVCLWSAPFDSPITTSLPLCKLITPNCALTFITAHLNCCILTRRHHYTKHWVKYNFGYWATMSTKTVFFWWAWDPFRWTAFITCWATGIEFFFCFCQFGLQIHHLKCNTLNYSTVYFVQSLQCFHVWLFITISLNKTNPERYQELTEIIFITHTYHTNKQPLFII